MVSAQIVQKKCIHIWIFNLREVLIRTWLLITFITPTSMQNLELFKAWVIQLRYLDLLNGKHSLNVNFFAT